MATGRLLSIHEALEEVNARLRAYGLIQDESEEVSTRTFRYYRSRDLLPDPEGAGPKARYPDTVLDRIVFVRRLQKERPELSLEMIAEQILPLNPEATISSVARGEEPLVVRDVAVREAASLAGEVFGSDQPDVDPAPARAVRKLASRAADYGSRMRHRPKAAVPKATETFHRIPLTDDVELNVRRRLSRKELEQLSIIGELIGSILESGEK